jgi:hypothetical protein
VFASQCLVIGNFAGAGLRCSLLSSVGGYFPHAAEKRAEESLSIEERIANWLRRWMKEWEADLDK